VKTLEVYRRADGLWDWRAVGGNGEIVATSGGQGFTERNDAREAGEHVLDGSYREAMLVEED
jgi:uncharacterized protein YegP (UPF0339 family)